MQTKNLESPCLIQTEHGDTVLYKEKYLYSKYNPSKSIINLIQNINILPGTLILCFSPVLTYGIKELSNKLNENCFMLGCELEQELLSFEQSVFNKENLINNELTNFTLLTREECLYLPQILQKTNYTFSCGIKLPSSGTFKRVIKIDFSAGVNFNIQIYNELYSYCVNSIMTFWKNRITLTKFGRKYSLDLFSNIKQIEKSTPISSYIGKINKPIILFGAGESTEDGIKEIQKQRKDFFILCADTALIPLINNNIIPDGVFIEEAQPVILKAFISTLNKNIHIFAGLSSVPQLKHLTNIKNISYFLTLYTECNFLNNLSSKSFIESKNQPFGSVGITMVYYALKFRKGENIPIYIYGLDFSYSIGKTHANGTMAHSNALKDSNRIKSIENYFSAFSENSKKITDKNDNISITTAILENYCTIFKNLFYKEKNLFDSGKNGLDLSLIKKNPEKININTDSNIIKIKKSFSQNQINDLQIFIQNEKKSLIYLKDILTGKIKLDKETQNKEIINTLENREYLYLHFADGYKLQLTQSFLNRIRTEIDFFLKEFD